MQSTILVGLLAPSSAAPNSIEMDTMNDVLGGTFTSRLNMNLREDKHWSYGVRSSLPDARGQRPWLLAAPVQTDQHHRRDPGTEARDRGIRRAEARDDRGDPEGLAIATYARCQGATKPTRRLQAQLREQIVFDRPDDYVRTLKARIEGQTDAGVHTAAREALDPTRLTWVIVGDLKTIEQPVRELGLRRGEGAGRRRADAALSGTRA